MKSKFSFLGLLLVALLTSFPAFSAVQVSATVNSNNVVLGDLFILTVSVNDNDDDYQLDTRQLEDNFTVYRPSQSQSSEYVNGSFSQKTQWQVRLQAKKTGVLTIPAFKIGDLSTQAIDINVAEASQQPESNAETGSVVFIENSIDKDTVYVGQSFVFTTKLYISKNSNELDLNAPHFEGAENTVFGQDSNSQTVRNGIRYNTITRQYKMTATNAGEFEIDSPLLTGTLRKVVAVSEWQNRVIAEPINVRGPRLTINVKAIPDSYKGTWIVSEDLRLIEDNDLTAQSYQVGEAITRSITLQIASVDKDKLPNIKLNYPKSLRVYPDQDQLEEARGNGLNYGIRIIRHAIIANEVGELILPEIKLNWFNSQTNQQETALLPAQTLTIIAADKPQINSAPTLQPTAPQAQPTIIVDHSALLYWQIAVALLIFINLFMIFYHLSYRRLQNTEGRKIPVVITPLNSAYLDLQSALKNEEVAVIYQALLSFAQSEFPKLKSLSQLPDHMNLDEKGKTQCLAEIKALEFAYTTQSTTWDATVLKQLIKQHIEQTNNVSNDVMNINPS